MLATDPKLLPFASTSELLKDLGRSCHAKFQVHNFIWGSWKNRITYFIKKTKNIIISYGDLASGQALVKVAHADYFTGRM